ncbi:helix-turn-helix transcriptional regulator [Isoptericola croceus]|uniref:helix-turn-helix transcriptional regulator n=1 Tax=Isoptericola croceus TaxID=3031406 RepID=UPI0023F66DF5|nr:YafY family protein [Isoptericola croceus]
MRADRLIRALLHLQARPRVTAADLAAALEVSVATARRDLEALSAAGVPVYPQRGRGGGWALVGGARTDLTGLTASEARALFLQAGPASSSKEARTALHKLVQALPVTFRAEAEAAIVATIVDRSRWGSAEGAPPHAVGALQQAVVARRRVAFRYTDGVGRESLRDVDPWGLVDKEGTWYLVAGTARGARTFRVDRATEVQIIDEPSQVPEDLDLDSVWDRVVGEVEALRSTTWATVLVAEQHVGVLRQQFGRHTRVDGPAGVDGRVQVRVGAPTALDVARHLAGWGAAAEVVGPPDVRDELSRLGAELVAQHAARVRAGGAVPMLDPPPTSNKGAPDVRPDHTAGPDHPGALA